MASGVVVFLLVLVPSLLFLVAGIVLLVYGIRRQRRDREALQAYVAQRLQEGGPAAEHPGHTAEHVAGEPAAAVPGSPDAPEGPGAPERGAPATTPPSQDNTGLVWAIVGGVLTFFGVTGLAFVLVVGAVVTIRSQTG